MSPSSTAGRSASCWALLKRWISSRKRIVRVPVAPSRSRARAITSRTFATVAETAESSSNSAPVVAATMRARVVLPDPGGPKRTSEGTRSASIASRSALPDPTTCSWPTKSSSVRGRSRRASGATSSSRLPAASSNRSPLARQYAPGGVREVWNEVAFERLAALLAPVQEELADRLAPRPGDRWLDVGDDGAVGFRAARAGAEVTVLDGPPLPVETARAGAEESALSIRFDTGDVEYLPYDDASFDVISSTFGFIYARDHANVSAELGRVARSSARLGFTAWKPNPKLGELYRRFTDEPIEGRESTEWGREDHVEDMLGDDFELEFFDGTLWIEADSGEEI